MEKIRLFILMSLMVMTGMMSAQNIDQILKDLKARIAPDGRTAIWDVSATMQNGVLTLYGKVDSNLANDSIESVLESNGIKYKNQIIVLENIQEEPWAFIKLAVATLRTEGRHSAETATQGIMGMPVKVLDKSGDWYRVQMPDSYIAYVPENSLFMADEARLLEWRKSKRYIVTAYQSQMIESPDSDVTVSDLVMGCIMEYRGSANKGEWIKLATPDGREGFVPAGDVKEFSEWANQDFDASVIEKTARRMMGSGYLWGGTTTKLTDCSGLVKVCYFANAIILQRDASQQALTGLKIAAEDWKQAKTGDLLFYGNSSGRVTHVCIYLRDGKYIHCSGQVKINSADPESEDFLSTPFLSISRIDGQVGTKGITAVKSHPWYF